MNPSELIQIVEIADVVFILGIAANLGVGVAVVCAWIARRRNGRVWRHK